MADPSPSHIIIVGGVAAGATAAARIRRLSETVKITLLERSPYVSYANCGLPYYIGGDIKVRSSVRRPRRVCCSVAHRRACPLHSTHPHRQERDRLFVQTPEGFRKRYNVDVRVNAAALDCDPKGKRLLVRVCMYICMFGSRDGIHPMVNFDVSVSCLTQSLPTPLHKNIGRGRVGGVAQLRPADSGAGRQRREPPGHPGDGPPLGVQALAGALYRHG